MRRDAFQAIADPTRREIINLLTKETKTLNEIAAHFEISRPAVSKHVKILNECGLLNIQKDGRRRHCFIEHEPLREVGEWIQQYERFWNNKLDNLGDYLNKKNS